MKFWIDFSASMEIEAENEEEAMVMFADKMPEFLDYIEVSCVEEKEEN